MNRDDDEECPCPDCQPPVYRYRPQQPAAARKSGKIGAGGGEGSSRDRTVAKLVYVCHPFAADPAGNAERVRRICEELKHSCVPLAPHLMLPRYLDEATERDLALRHCLRLVAACDEVRVYGEPTDGMQLEIAEALRLRVPIVVVDDGQERRPPGRDLEAGSGAGQGPC